MLALLAVRWPSVFWPSVVAYNLVGIVDLVVDYYHGVVLDLPALAGQLSATYVIPIVYVPLLMITHVAALYLLMGPQPKADGMHAAGGDKGGLSSLRSPSSAR